MAAFGERAVSAIASFYPCRIRSKTRIKRSPWRYECFEVFDWPIRI